MMAAKKKKSGRPMLRPITVDRGVPVDSGLLDGDVDALAGFGVGVVLVVEINVVLGLAVVASVEVPVASAIILDRAASASGRKHLSSNLRSMPASLQAVSRDSQSGICSSTEQCV